VSVVADERDVDVHGSRLSWRVKYHRGVLEIAISQGTGQYNRPRSMFEAIGHYRILDRIGTGGIGEVYRARDTRHGRTAAIKIVTRRIAADPDRRQRFLLEAQAAAALSHPNIAALYEIGEDQNELFLVFEFVPGESLDRVIGGRPLNPRRAADFPPPVAHALAQ